MYIINQVFIHTRTLCWEGSRCHVTQWLHFCQQEVRKLTEQCEKLKRSMKRVEEKSEGTSKKRFDPNKAFNHPSRKENTPLSVISNGKYTTFPIGQKTQFCRN